MRKNQNGCWEFNKPHNTQNKTSPISRSQENIDNNCMNIIPMSSSATISDRDHKDSSVNQDGGRNLDFSAVNGIDYDSMSLNIDATNDFNDRIPPPSSNAEVIVLIDSDEEIEPIMSSEVVYKNPSQQIHDFYYENTSLSNVGNSCVGLYCMNDDEFAINMWSLPPGSQAGPSFQLFSYDVDVVPESLVDLHHVSLNCPSSINGYTLTGETAMGGSAERLPESNVNDMNDGSVDNRSAFSGNDPSLQIFLPTRPSDASAAQPYLREHRDVSNGVHTEDWISLRLGDGDAGANDLNAGQQLQTKDATLNSLPKYVYERESNW